MSENQLQDPSKSSEDAEELSSPSANSSTSAPRGREPDHMGSVWTHPYTLYILLTILLFLFLLFLSWYVWSHGLVPNRGFR